MTATIFALSTAPGRSGVAVVRASGPQAWAGLQALAGRSINPTPRQSALVTLFDPAAKTPIDRALILPFKAPASYTGEDVIEYHIHGGRAVIDSLLAALTQLAGHRLAEPGEFTRRAFENARLDLTQAEAVADLINAETEAQKMQALAQMGGALLALYQAWAETLTTALAHLEADIEFPDEDLPPGISEEILWPLKNLAAEIAAHLNDNRRGERLRDGIHIAIIGAPNAGKSSLVNALAQREVAIVSPHAGTTRDVIEAHLDLAGYPVIIADTAGLRPDQVTDEAHDQIESEGMRRALQRAQQADIKLLVFDGTAAEPDPHTLALIDETALLVVSKGDRKCILRRPWPAIEISVQTGAGLQRLLEAIVQRIESLYGRRDAPPLTRPRHRAAVEEAQQSLVRALAAALPELMAEDIRLALRAIGRITGKVDVEDLLDIVFRDFCIGK